MRYEQSTFYVQNLIWPGNKTNEICTKGSVSIPLVQYIDIVYRFWENFGIERTHVFLLILSFAAILGSDLTVVDSFEYW